MVKMMPAIVAPLLHNVLDEEPVNATMEDFGDDELPEGATVDVVIVVEAICGDGVLHCDVEGVPIGMVKEWDTEDESFLLVPSFAPEAMEMFGCAWEDGAAACGALLIDATDKGEVASGNSVVPVSWSIDVVTPELGRVYAWVGDELAAICPGGEIMLVGILVKVAVEALVDSTVAWWTDEPVHCEYEDSRACTLVARPKRAIKLLMIVGVSGRYVREENGYV
jgi:hypothetical protein